MEIIPTQKIINRDGIKAVKNGQKSNKHSSVPNQKKPEWIRVKATFDKNFKAVKQQVKDKRLNTVCEEAMCPNISECWSAGTATFMLMGSVCTRACKFCSVDTGNPKGWLDLDEPMHTAKAVKTMGLKYVVLTSVNRDDKNYESAKIFANSIREIKKLKLDIKIEALIPDFLGNKDCYNLIVESAPDVLNHNIETIERLYKFKQETGTDKRRSVRPQAIYKRSLELLEYFSSYESEIVTKSGIMIGLGEEKSEIFKCIDDLDSAGCQIITVGQYLQPSRKHINVSKYYTAEEFEEIKIYSEKKPNIISSECGAMVRSSYHAETQLKNAIKNKKEGALN